MENKNKGIFERSEKTVFVWVSKRNRVRRSSPMAASHDSWITVNSKTITHQYMIQRDKLAWERWRIKTKEFLSGAKKLFLYG